MNALLIFLVIVILVTAVLVYLYFNKLGPWKKEKSQALAPAPAQTQVLPSITDISVDRTLSPDGSSESYTIEPYTIEPYTAQDIIALSKNVNFTLEWKNGIGFKEVGVDKIEVYHGVMNETTNSFDNNTGWIPRKRLTMAGYLKNFATVITSISGRDIDDTDDTEDIDGDPYSFQGNNFFKIVAYYGTSSIVLYNSYILWKNETNGTEKEKLAVKISNDELVGTLAMTSSETVTYKPRLDSGKGQSVSKKISNQRYNFYYYDAGTEKTLFENVRLVPVDDSGTQFKLEKNDGEYFKVSGTEYSFNKINISNATTVYIAESKETYRRGHDKVIMIRALGDYYLFGTDGFKKLNDPTISTADDFFRRNIYISAVVV